MIIRHRPIKQDSYKKRCVQMKKLGKLFLPHLPVPLRYIEKPGPRITPHSTKKKFIFKVCDM